MVHLLIYDIESDRIRVKVARACQEQGMERVQFSAFWGELSENECEELLLECQEIIGDEPARIHILPLCKTCFSRRRTYATAQFEGGPQTPPDRDATVWFLPDEPPDKQGERMPDQPPSASKVDRALMDVVRRLPRRDKPVGLTDDPWENPDDAAG
ncbi:MAG: CRISPR-associated endonuclease Cas2 [Armatimonadetes bacterium]|jgi:CRISPR-associated protein Cas2|nr:CRISPR-associated endonuclease Cas2 [Armatimonadota bacterium]MDI9582801.1 CRISPR-associated endonuclease Cas2 [Acidobacteriota bacterium]